MGSARFIPPSANLITAASMITPSSNAAGAISNAQKEGAGSGTMAPTGDYTGLIDRDYFVQIDLAGELGVATFKWSHDDGATFTAVGVVTSAVATALELGISILFLGGAGVDFVLGDLWRFKAFRPYGVARLLDLNRNTEWRSASDVSAAIDLSIDLGAPGALKALVIDQHNFSAAAVIRIQADDDPAYGSLDIDEVVPWAKGQIVYYVATLPQSFRYPRLRMTDPGNADGYLRIANLCLGGYTQLSRNFAPGVVRTRQRVAQRIKTPSGAYFGGLNAMAELFELHWKLLEAADQTLLLDVFAACMDEVNRVCRPTYFHPDSATVTVTRQGVAYGDVYLCEWDGDGVRQHVDGSVAGYDMPLRLDELPRTRA